LTIEFHEPVGPEQSLSGEAKLLAANFSVSSGSVGEAPTCALHMQVAAHVSAELWHHRQFGTDDSAEDDTPHAQLRSGTVQYSRAVNPAIDPLLLALSSSPLLSLTAYVLHVQFAMCVSNITLRACGARFERFQLDWRPVVGLESGWPGKLVESGGLHCVVGQ
jgi:hypothetical protein